MVHRISGLGDGEQRLFSMSGQREALPDSGSHHLFNTLLAIVR